MVERRSITGHKTGAPLAKWKTALVKVHLLNTSIKFYQNNICSG
jgi:hypothetical protein